MNIKSNITSYRCKVFFFSSCCFSISNQKILVMVLEKICFSPIVLSKELRDDVYNSLAKFAEIHRKTTQIIEIGLDNNFKPNFNQFNRFSRPLDFHPAWLFQPAPRRPVLPALLAHHVTSPR